MSRFKFDLGQQMQHLHQMRMLQSFGQYSQLGFSGLNSSHFGSSPNSSDHSVFELKDGRSIGGGKAIESKKQKRKKSSNVKRPTTAYLYFVSKYREEVKNAGNSMPKVRIHSKQINLRWGLASKGNDARVRRQVASDERRRKETVSRIGGNR